MTSVFKHDLRMDLLVARDQYLTAMERASVNADMPKMRIRYLRMAALHLDEIRDILSYMC